MKEVFAILMALIVLTACNTIEGVGKDVKSLGQSVENAASRK